MGSFDRDRQLRSRRSGLTNYTAGRRESQAPPTEGRPWFRLGSDDRYRRAAAAAIARVGEAREADKKHRPGGRGRSPDPLGKSAESGVSEHGHCISRARATRSSARCPESRRHFGQQPSKCEPRLIRLKREDALAGRAPSRSRRPQGGVSATGSVRPSPDRRESGSPAARRRGTRRRDV